MSFQVIIITLLGIIIIVGITALGYYCFNKFNSKKVMKKLEDMSGHLIIADDGPDNNKVEDVNANDTNIQNGTVVEGEVKEDVQDNVIMVNGNVCCKYCGSIIDNGSKICKNCGKEQ
ncbi:MAG: hypothetical protein VZS44_08520 [Bacilli bacterium]|nr:hypothetical protein [Bacilli bacterium]